MTNDKTRGSYYICPKHIYYVAKSGRVWVKEWNHDERRSVLLRRVDSIPANCWLYDGFDGHGKWSASDVADAERFERDDIARGEA